MLRCALTHTGDLGKVATSLTELPEATEEGFIRGGNGGSICSHGRPRPLRRIWRSADLPAATLHMYGLGGHRLGELRGLIV